MVERFRRLCRLNLLPLQINKRGNKKDVDHIHLLIGNRERCSNVWKPKKFRMSPTRVAAFKVVNKPELLSLPTRDIADFAYLLFFDSSGMSLIKFVSVRYVWRTIISCINNVISQ